MNSAVRSGARQAERLKQLLRKNWKSLLVVAISVLLVQDIFGTHGVLAMRRSQKEAAEIRTQIKQLSTENCRLEERAKDLESDPATIEKIAREDLALGRKDDHIFKVTPETDASRGDVELNGDAQKKCEQAKQ